MKQYYITTLVAAMTLACSSLCAQTNSFIVLGDIHYDRLADHDFAWIANEKAGDLSQIEGYTANIQNNWSAFMKHLRFVVKTNPSPVKAIVQLGDLSEGLAGDTKADQMAKSVVRAVEQSRLGAPWIITKGNHDVTSGTAAKNAFTANYIPMIQRLTGNTSINSANYSYKIDNAEFFVCDYYERNSTDFIAWLDEAAKASTALHKFACFHEPVIPVTERCWHMYKTDQVNRTRLLRTLAENKMVVLAGHLHRYSVVKRTTEWGPIVQIMTSSVISNRNTHEPSKIITKYGPSIATDMPTYEPNTLEERKAYLTAEEPFVSYYKQTTLHGFSLLTVNNKNKTIELKYYAGFNCEAYDTVDISELMRFD